MLCRVRNLPLATGSCRHVCGKVSSRGIDSTIHAVRAQHTACATGALTLRHRCRSSGYQAGHRRSRRDVDSTMSCGLCALIQTRVRCGPHGVSSASEWNVLHVEMTTDCMGRGVTPLPCQDPQVATELKERTCVRDEAVCKNRTRNTVTFGEHSTPILHSTLCFARVRVFRPRKAHRSPASRGQDKTACMAAPMPWPVCCELERPCSMMNRRNQSDTT